ncbi:MAG: AbrB family transcriptional regulator [Micropepsaceae bacterium]
MKSGKTNGVRVRGRVVKLDDGLAVCVPRAVIVALRLKEGDAIEVFVLRERPLEVSTRVAPKELLKRLRRLRGRLPAGFKFDRLAANARG